MDAQKSSVTIRSSDGTILKLFLIDDGRFIVEIDMVDFKNFGKIMFSIRGSISPENIPKTLQTANEFINNVISGNGD